MKRRVLWILIGAAVIAGVAVTLRPRAVPVETGRPERMTVREFIAEDAETQLADTYTVDMPVAGTLERIAWKIGDEVRQGDVLARVEALPFEEQLRGIEASISQINAQIAGVDVAKPKPETLEQAQKRVAEAAATLEMARKARSVAEINFEQAKKNFDRAQALQSQGVMSQREFDQADSAYRALEQDLARAKLAEQAAQRGVEIVQLASKELTGSVDDNEFMREAYQAQIESLESQAAILRDQLAKTTILAPVSGPILMKFVEDARTLPPGTPILTLGDPVSSEIVCDVLSEEVVRVEPGDPVEIAGKALGGKTIAGKVKRIYPAAFKKISSLGIEQQRVRVLIDYDAANVPLRPGTSVDVRIITAESPDALAVPERSIFQVAGMWHIYAVQSGRARLTPITVGLKNDEWAEIRDGLDADASIILDPPNDLADGSRVAPK